MALAEPRPEPVVARLLGTAVRSRVAERTAKSYRSSAVEAADAAAAVARATKWTG